MSCPWDGKGCGALSSIGWICSWDLKATSSGNTDGATLLPGSLGMTSGHSPLLQVIAQLSARNWEGSSERLPWELPPWCHLDDPDFYDSELYHFASHVFEWPCM